MAKFDAPSLLMWKGHLPAKAFWTCYSKRCPDGASQLGNYWGWMAVRDHNMIKRRAVWVLPSTRPWATTPLGFTRPTPLHI